MNFMQRMFGSVKGSAESLRNPEVWPGLCDERRANIIKWWTYYHGSDPAEGKNQWDYLYSRFETMPHRELEDVENHTRICTDRLRRLLVNSFRGFEFEDEEAGNRVREVFGRNRWPHLLNLTALAGKVTGDAFIKLAPSSPESRFGPVRLILLDSEAVELEVSPHDRDNILSVTVSYDFFEDEDGAGRRRRYCEIIDGKSVTAFVDGESAPEYSMETETTDYSR